MTPRIKSIMLKIFAILILVLTIGLFLFTPRFYAVPKPVLPQAGSYRIMTYNLRYSASDYTAWENRRNAIIQLIFDYQPDSIGLQEADWGWMDFLPNALQNYSYYGVGRNDGDTQGEYAPIFYLSDKFILIDNDTFWLSETPEEPSYGWDANNRRICSYVVLKKGRQVRSSRILILILIMWVRKPERKGRN